MFQLFYFSASLKKKSLSTSKKNARRNNSCFFLSHFLHVSGFFYFRQASKKKSLQQAKNAPKKNISKQTRSEGGTLRQKKTIISRKKTALDYCFFLPRYPLAACLFAGW